jgi:hypothetical protein
MERHFLPAVHDRGNDESGTYCTKWEGWRRYPSGCYFNFEQCTQPKKGQYGWYATEHISYGPGVYAFFYYPTVASDSTRYVLYVGSTATDVVKRAMQSRDRFERYWDWSKMGVGFALVKTEHQGRDSEYYLIRYYAPPWNTKFSK